MRLLIETPAEPDSASYAANAPDGTVAKVLAPGVEQTPVAPPFARRWSGNLLKLTTEQITTFGGGRVIVNSGSLRDDLGSLDPRNWMAPGMAALSRLLESIESAVRAAGVHLLLEPHSRHILHDAQVAGIYLSQFSGEPFGLALNPTALFEPSMLSVREDHLQRIAEALAPRASALILADVRPNQEQERLTPCEPGRGIFDLLAVLTACLPHLPSETPVVVRRIAPGSGSTNLIDSLAQALASKPSH